MINERPPIIKLNDPELDQAGVELFVHQLYLIHPTIGGNKWFKLKYNLQEAKRLGLNTILTFGGAYSNHIYATAAACKEFGFRSIGVIRGERTELNSTLTFAESCGMTLHFVDRETYRNKHTDIFIENIKQQFGEFYLIPEGGSNLLGVKGCMEIMNGARDKGQGAGEIASEEFDYVCCACGTGATLAGVSLSLKPHQQAIGFSALKGGGFLEGEVEKFRDGFLEKKPPRLFEPSLQGGHSRGLSELLLRGGDFKINTDYHFGGYAKTTPELIEFAKAFEKQHNIPLDYVYTVKMFFGLYDLIRKGYFKKGSKIIALHTGGLQGNQGLVRMAPSP
jgi:1-aminocyclopropane-1-carboxylate deaminase